LARSRLKTTISQWLEGARRVALLGVGSDLRGDDVAGVLVAQSLDEKSRKSKFKKKFKAFIGATAPENLTGEIRRFRPTHLIIVDAADLKDGKAAVRCIHPAQTDGFSSSTHNLPMKVFADYLIHTVGCEIMIVGIKPERLDFDAPPSQGVKKSVKYVADMISGILSE
jgi:hydrogenase 3 maturation protease